MYAYAYAYLSVPLHPAAPAVLPKWLVDAVVPNVLAVEPLVPVRFQESNNGCSPGFRPRSFRLFFRDRSISEAVADTCVCDAVVTHGGDILSLDVEKNPCWDILWPNCGRFMISFEFIIPAKMQMLLLHGATQYEIANLWCEKKNAMEM